MAVTPPPFVFSAGQGVPPLGPLERKRLVEPSKTRHFKRMLLLDETVDDWRRATSASTLSNTSTCSDEDPGLLFVTEMFSGVLVDFLGNYDNHDNQNNHADKSPRSFYNEGETTEAAEDTITAAQSGDSNAPSHPAPSPHDTNIPDWHSHSDKFASSPSNNENSSPSSDADSESDSAWDDEDPDTPGSPGSDVELDDGILRRGQYMTVLLASRGRGIPCAAKVVAVHDRRGLFTMRLTKSARRTARTTFARASPRGASRSPRSPRGRS